MMTVKFRKSISVLGAAALALGMVGATLDVASARTVKRAVVPHANAQSAIMDDTDMMMDSGMVVARSNPGPTEESRIQVPTFTGGLRWVSETEYHGGAASDD